MSNKRNIAQTLAFLFLLFSSSLVSGQIIAEENFDEINGATSGMMSDGSLWLAEAPGQCDGSAGVFAVQGGGFVIQDIEGFNCCDCGGGAGAGNCGDNQSTINFNDIDISAGCMVDITIDWTSQGNMECDSPGTPSDVCIGGHDQMVASYSVDNAPYVVFGYFCGNTVVQIPTTGFVISGTSLDIRITGGNQASSEIYTVNSIVVESMGVAVTGTLTGGGDLCGTNCTTVEWNIVGGTPPYTLDMNFTLGAFDIDFTVPAPTATGFVDVCLDPSTPIPFFNPPSTIVLNEAFGSLATIEMTGITDNSGCSVTLSNQIIDINLIDEPIANMIDPIDSICIEIGGMATVDLSLYEDLINDEAGNTVIWYSDPALNNEIGPIFMTSTNTTIYAVVSSGPGCQSDDIQVQILLSITPQLDPIAAVFACGEYEIPFVTGTNLTSNAGFFSAPGGTGTQYFAGEIITMNTVIYIYDDNDGCTDEEQFTVTILPEPFLDPLIPIMVCGFYILPELTGVNLVGNETYYTLPGGMGFTYAEGDTITESIVLYAYAELGSCSDEEFLPILISQAPEINMPLIIEACGSVTLPEIAGSNISANAMYYTGAMGTGNTFVEGDIITMTQILYVFDEIGNCSDEIAININISEGPMLFPIDPIISCEYYVLPDEHEGNSLTDPAYFGESGAMGVSYQPGDTIFSDIIIYCYDSVVGNGLCFSEVELNIDIVNPISAGDSITSNSCVGSVINLTNLLGAGIPTDGTFVDLNATGALTNDTLDLNLSGDTQFILSYEVSNFCGADTAFLIIDVVDDTDAGAPQDNSICEGSLISLEDFVMGDPGGSFYNEGEIVPITNDLSTDGQLGNTIEVIYVVGDGNNCPQDTAVYQFEIIDQPVFFAPTTITVCDFAILGIVDGEGINGDENYTTLPFGGGVIFEAGDTIFQDMKLYLSFDDGFCQALDSVNINVSMSSTEMISPMLCPDESIEVEGTVFDISLQSGVMMTTNAQGCDSTIIVNLNFFEPDTNFIVSNLCFGETLIINGTTYDEDNTSGIETLENMSFTGCDSLISVSLEFSDAAVTPILENICSGDSILINNTYYSEENPSGMDTITMPGGCDSILNIVVSFLQNSSGNIDSTICPTDMIVINGTIYDIDNDSGTETFDNAEGCDSIVSVNLSFTTVQTGMVSGTLCPGESIDTLGVIIDMDNPSEEVVLAGASSTNCDSTVMIVYDFIVIEEGMLEQSTCEGSSIEIEGTTYTEQSPTGSFTTTTSEGCDSTVNVLVTFTPVLSDFSIENADCGDSGTGILIYLGLNVSSAADFYSLDSGDPISINFGDTIFGINPGIHEIIFSNTIGCVTSETFEILEPITPTVNIPETVTISEGNTYQLVTPLDETNTILWTPPTNISCTDCGNPEFSPSVTTEYVVEIISPEGCTVLDTILIRVEESFNIYFPNTFTPNDDGVNDYFNIFAEQDGAYDLFVYDRWGNQVFETRGGITNGPTNGWDGKFNQKAVDQGVYAYYGIYYQVISPTEVEAIPFQGSVTIFR
ncbi:gliding motility-associated C-terminal domain-containing protein [Saprospiraceae bacterium]|nr:gliding motility-associated C-terminal domain-containing protein [Saprospiraceae bacterium]